MLNHTWIPNTQRNVSPGIMTITLTSNQNANWCVTKPWFDYIMGTRVMTDVSVTETNPLAIKIPKWLEKDVNKAARRLLPKA